MPCAAKELAHSRGTSPMADRYCNTCDKEFSRPSELTRHRERTLIHNPNARRFKCRFCPKAQTQKSNIRTHELIHFGEHRKERCCLPLDSSGTKECMFACSDPSSMLRHIDNKHFAPYRSGGLPIPDWLKQGQQARLAAKSASRRTSPSHSTLSNSSSPPEFSRPGSSSPILSVGTSLPVTPAKVHEPPMSTQNIPEVDNTIITSNTFPFILPDLEMDLTNFNFNCDLNQPLEAPTFTVPQNEELAFDPMSALFSQAADAEFFQFPLLPQFDGEQPSVTSDLSNIGDLILPAEATTTHFGDVDFAVLLDSASQMNYQVPPVSDSLSPLNFFSSMGPEVQLDLYNFP